MHVYISTFGSYLHIRDQMFEVKYKEDGKTVKKLIPPKRVRSIVLDRGTSLSYEAVKTALKHNIDIVFAEGDGAPLGRVWHSKLGSTTLIRKRQLEASLGSEGLELIIEWLSGKCANQIDVLKELKKHRAAHKELLDNSISRITELRDKILAVKAEFAGEVSDTLRGYEGSAGRAYFGVLAELMPNQYKFKGRSSRPADDVFNAMLNYGYGILYTRIEKAIMLAGLDPYVGFMHRDDYNQKSFVFDFIEPYRPFVDLTIYRLFSGKKVADEHTRQITNGVGLTKEGKALVVEHFTKRFDTDTIRYKGRNQTRMNAIQMDAHAVANTLIKRPGATATPDFKAEDLPF